MFVSDGGYDAGETSHAVLLELRRTIGRHPGITDARGHPQSLFTRLRAAVDPAAFGGASEAGVLTVRWFAGESEESPPEFAVHYSDESGFDCGWHHEPNPHVEGWAHYQVRESERDPYEYERISFESVEPVRVLWEVLDRLEDVLQRRA